MWDEQTHLLSPGFFTPSWEFHFLEKKTRKVDLLARRSRKRGEMLLLREGGLLMMASNVNLIALVLRLEFIHVPGLFVYVEEDSNRDIVQSCSISIDFCMDLCPLFRFFFILFSFARLLRKLFHGCTGLFKAFRQLLVSVRTWPGL